MSIFNGPNICNQCGNKNGWHRSDCPTKCPRCGREYRQHADGCQNPEPKKKPQLTDITINENGFLIFDPKNTWHMKQIWRMLPEKYTDAENT